MIPQLDEVHRRWMATAFDPVADFGVRLQEEKNRAGLTFRQIADATHYSHPHMARAAKGQTLPTWPVAEAFLTACGVDAADMPTWRHYWRSTQEFLQATARLRKSAAELAARTSPNRRFREPETTGLTTKKSDLYTELILKLRAGRTAADLGSALRQLLTRKGLASVRQAARLTGCPRSTLFDWVEGNRLPHGPRLDDLVQRLGASPLEQREFAACLERIRERRPWTDDNIAQLRDLAAHQEPMSLLVVKLNRTEEDIRDKGLELEIELPAAKGRRPVVTHV